VTAATKRLAFLALLPGLAAGPALAKPPPIVGAWFYRAAEDGLGRGAIMSTLYSSAPDGKYRLVLRCKTNQVEVFVLHTGAIFSADRKPVRVEFRFDDGKIDESRWVSGVSGNSVYFRYPSRLIDDGYLRARFGSTTSKQAVAAKKKGMDHDEWFAWQIARSERFRAIVYAPDKLHSLEFNPGGLVKPVNRVLRACGRTPIP